MKILLTLLATTLAVLPAQANTTFSLPPAAANAVLRLDAARQNTVIFVDGVAAFTRPVADVSELTIDGNARDNTLTVDFSSGNPIPPGGLNYNGGDQETATGDALALIGDGPTSTRYIPTVLGAGILQLCSGAAADAPTSIIRFTGLEPITDTTPTSTFTLNGTATANTIGILNGVEVSQLKVAIDAFETIEFNNKINLVINAGDLGDTVNVNFNNTVTALSSITLNGDAGDDTFNLLQSGGSPAMTINGGTGANIVRLGGTNTGIFSPGAFALNDATLEVDLNGTTPGTQYDQLSVTGNATIGANVTLNVVTSGGFTPSPGQSFTIISCVGGSPFGIFAGLPNGATVSAKFLNSGFPATINYSPNAVVLTVNKADTTTTLTSSLNPSVFGQFLTFTATVSSGAGTPTGTVIFSVDGTLSPPVTLTGGVATFTTSSLAVGSRTITATYNGDPMFNVSTSPTLTQTVNPGPGPNRSSPIALSTGNLLVSVNPDTNTITIFDALPVTPVKLAEVAVGNEPSSVAISPDGATAYVANAADGTVSVVNLATRAQVALVNAGAEPMALALSPNGTRLYVANSASETLGVFNTTTPASPTQVATVDLSAFGTAPRAIAVTDDGDVDDTDETIFVALFFGQLRPGKTFLDEGQDDQREGRVVAISAATSTVLGTVPLGPLANTGFNSNGKLAPANGLTPAVAQTNPQTFTTPTAAFPNQLAGLAIDPVNQSRAYVVSTAASPNGPARFNQNVQGLVSVFNTGTRNEITAGQTGAGVRQTAPLNLNQGINLATTPAPRLFLSNPTAIAWRPNGSDAWIAVQQSDLLVRMTIDANGIPTINAPLVAGPSQIVRVDLQGGAIPGKAPRGVVINAAGTRAYVLNYVSRSISVVDISNPTAPSIAASVQATALPLPNTPEATAQLGAELFHSGRGPNGGLASESWGACVVCHPNGRSDNVTWMFDGGPRQTIPLDGTFGPTHQSAEQRILNWSATRDEIHDFELNTRNVFGGRGLIDDDRLFLAFGGASTAEPTDSPLVEQFNQFTGAVGTVNDFTTNAIPAMPGARRDFAIATLEDGRVFIIGGRSGVGQGALINDTNTVLEFNTRSNSFRTRSATGFTPRHSFGAAAVRTSGGLRIYAIGGYAGTAGSELPVGTVQEYNPATDTWRTVASLPTAVAQFGITVSGGVNTAEPLQLIHVVSGNTGSENAPSVTNPNPVQRFQADPTGPGTWSAFSVTGLTLRRNHGVATVLRGVSSRVFVIGGQDAAGSVLSTVEEYLGQAVTIVATPHTSLPAPRARFGIVGNQSANQIYVIGGVDGTGADQTTVFEYTVANNGPVAGPAGTPSGSWVTRGNLSAARRGLQVSAPPGVLNYLPSANTGRSATQDALAAFVQRNMRPAKAPVPATDPGAQAGRTLFGTTGLVQPGFSCASCHGGPTWTRSRVDFITPPSPEIGLGLGSQRVIGAELRQTATQNPAFPASGQAPGVLISVGTFAPNAAGGRVNEIRANAADISQAIAPLGANGFNIPSLLSVHETAPYFYNGLAQSLNEVFDGSKDGNGGTQHHFVANPSQRAQLVAFLRSIDATTPIFPVSSPTTTTLTSSANPSVFGQAVTFTATVSSGAGTPTGTVTFTVDGTAMSPVTLSGGVATFTPSNLTVASHTITVAYNGDGSFSTSASATLTQVANQAATITILASSQNPSVSGQPVTFTATVSAIAPGGGTPTGTVTFNRGDGSPTVVVTLDGSGQATLTTSYLAVGSYTVTATYAGDINFLASTATLTQVVNKAATGTSVGAIPNPLAFGQLVPLSATVTAQPPGAGTPTGTVQFNFDNANPTITIPLSGGTTSSPFSYGGLSVGPHSLSAVYSGDGNFLTSTSVVTFVVGTSDTVTTLTSSANPSVSGQPVTFTATVSSTPASTNTPTGTATFTVDGVAQPVSLYSNGQATLTTSSLAAGSHTVSVAYGGSASFNASASAQLTQVVNKAATTTTLASSANPSVFGQSVTFTATVNAVAPGAGTPTGSVTFSVDGTPMAPVLFIGGVATFTTSSLTVASHTIGVAYNGDASFNTSASAPLTQVVNKAATSTALSSVTAGPFFPGQQLTATYQVSAVAPGAGTPTGTVTLTNELSSVGGPAPGGTLITLLASPGTFHFGADYSGDGNFLPSSSPTVTRTVVSLTDPAVFLTTTVDHTSARFFQTTLMQQSLTLSNATSQILEGLRVTVHLSAAEKAAKIRVYNASGTNNETGDPYLQHNFPVPPGGTVTFTAEYYSPDRVTVPNPTFTVELVTPEVLVAPPGTTQSVLGNNPRVLPPDNAFLIDFTTVAGARYYILYKDDPASATWSVAQPSVPGTGYVVQWVDNGVPKTKSHPGTQPQRIYQVHKAD